MDMKKKAFLFVITFALIVVLVNASSQIIHNSTSNDSYPATNSPQYMDGKSPLLTLLPAAALPPAAYDDVYAIDEDIHLLVPAPGALENDYADDKTIIVALLDSGPLHGLLNLWLNGSFSYIPNPDFYGTDTFTYYFNDGQVDSNIATVTISINTVNDAPVAVDDEFTMDGDTVLPISTATLLSNDFDVDGDLLQFLIDSDPSFGTLSVLSDDELAYTPSPSWSGIDSFTYMAFDGREYSATAQVTITVLEVIYDTTPPITILTPDGVLSDNGWYISDVTVTLTATDDMSLVADTYYSVNGETWLLYTDPFVVSSEGINTVSFYSVDAADNIESIQSSVLQVDTTPPEIEITFDGDVVITITDLGSGIFYYSYTVSDTSWIISDSNYGFGENVIVLRIYPASDGFVDVSAEAINIVGMIAQKSWSFWFDRTPPETSIDFSGTLGDNGWYISDVVVTLTATDENSVDSTMYSLDGKNFFPYFEPFTIATDGPTTVWYYSNDTSSNIEPTKSASIIIDTDTTAPIIAISYTGDGTDGNPGYWIVTVDDPESGVALISVGIDGVLVGTAPGNYSVPNSLGSHTIQVNTTNADSHEQESSTDSMTNVIVDDDTEGPEISIVYSDGTTITNPGNWTVSVFDAESGVASIVVEIDGTIVDTTAGDYPVPDSEGIHNITVTAYNGDLDRGEIDQEVTVVSDNVTITGGITPGFVIGGGWIIDENGNRGHFCFVVHLKPDGEISGIFTYAFKDGRWFYMVVGTEFSQMTIDGNYVYFEVNCSIVRMKPHSCKAFCIDDGYIIRVDAWETPGRHERDIFQIRIYDASGELIYKAGFDPYGYVHGAIVVYEYKHLKHCHCHHHHHHHGRW